MARLEKLGITIELGEKRVAKLRERFPEIELLIELDFAKIPRSLADVDAFIGQGSHVALLSYSTQLKWIQTLTAGVEAISFTDLATRGIVLTNGSGIDAPNLAEHLLGMMLAFARNLPELMRRQQRHEWSQESRQFELADQTLCVIGLGDIGLALAERSYALGMRVTGVRRRDIPCPPFVATVARLETMDSLLAEADHVAICLPLTGHTGTVFNAERLRVLKQGAYLYNIGRGELVNQDR